MKSKIPDKEHRDWQVLVWMSHPFQHRCPTQPDTLREIARLSSDDTAEALEAHLRDMDKRSLVRSGERGYDLGEAWLQRRDDLERRWSDKLAILTKPQAKDVPAPLGERERRVMDALRRADDRSQIDLAKAAAVDAAESPADTFAAIASLEKRGLVATQPHVDPHFTVVSMTAKGRARNDSSYVLAGEGLKQWIVDGAARRPVHWRLVGWEGRETAILEDERTNETVRVDLAGGYELAGPVGHWQLSSTERPSADRILEELLDGAVLAVVRTAPHGITHKDLHARILGGDDAWTVGRACTIHRSTCRLRERGLLRTYDPRGNAYLLPIYQWGDWPAPEFWPKGKLGSEASPPDIDRAKLRPAPFAPPWTIG